MGKGTARQGQRDKDRVTGSERHVQGQVQRDSDRDRDRRTKTWTETETGKRTEGQVQGQVQVQRGKTEEPNLFSKFRLSSLYQE